MWSMKTLLPRESIYAERVVDIVDAAARIVQADGRFALITSLSIEGGAAREVGSLAIVEPDGKMTGYLSNGCTATARRHGISRSLLTVWRRQYRNGELAIASGPAFVPVKMAPDIDAPSPRQPGPDVQIEIVLRNGRRLLVPSSVELDALARLLPVIEGR
ncbi:transposase [Ruegeria pomeroyi]|nr:transposase [Ruegeria pomeroyi]